jgi:hypothetical protein
MSEQGSAILEAARRRSGGDPHRLEVELALELARADKELLEELASGHGELLHRERRARKGGRPSPTRQRLAERLLAMPEPTEAQLREVLDEASMGDVPRDLCALWLPLHARALALRSLGEAAAMLTVAETADESLVDEASALVSSLEQGGSGALTPRLREAPPPEAARALQLAMDRWLSAPKPDIKSLSRGLRACREPAVIVPLVLWQASNQHHRLGRALRAYPVGPAALVAVLTDPGRDERANPLSMAPDWPDTLLSCVVWSELASGKLSEGQEDYRWRVLGQLGEPVALAERLRPERIYGLFDPQDLVPHPNVLRVLLDILQRKDPRTIALWDRPAREGEDAPMGPHIWRLALSLVADVALRCDGAERACKVLWQVLDRELLEGGLPEDIRYMGLVLGRLGDPESLPLVLESLQRQGPHGDVCLALRALGEKAQAALPWLEGPDPWAWLAREATEPHDPQWAHKLLAWLGGPEAATEVHEVQLQYTEGLITAFELRSKLALQLEALACLRRRGERLPPEVEALVAQLGTG